MEVRVWQ
jgi:6-phosphogluconolactonase (cycloisomerase 2 family)